MVQFYQMFQAAINSRNSIWSYGHIAQFDYHVVSYLLAFILLVGHIYSATRGLLHIIDFFSTNH